MRKTILETPKQFLFEPKIFNFKKFKKFNKFLVAGMGGSNLVTDLIKIRDPSLDIISHRNYGLPPKIDDRLIIVSSYSGNTEETIDAFEKAIKNKLTVVAVSTGGRLISLAKKYKVPYVLLPKVGIQPRASLGFQTKAILKIMEREDLLVEISELSKTLKPEEFQAKGKNLAKKLKGYLPIIYSSAKNQGIAYSWKIKFNETGKIPAFYNVFPELNHNEMTGFDLHPKIGARKLPSKERKKLNERFYFIFLKDKDDHPRIQRRMEITKQLYEKKGLPVEFLEFSEKSIFHKIFSSLVLADWTAFYLAQIYGLESEKVPMIEEFKKLI